VRGRDAGGVTGRARRDGDSRPSRARRGREKMFVILKNDLKYIERERIESNRKNVHGSVAPRRGGAAVDVARKKYWKRPTLGVIRDGLKNESEHESVP